MRSGAPARPRGLTLALFLLVVVGTALLLAAQFFGPAGGVAPLSPAQRGGVARGGGRASGTRGLGLSRPGRGPLLALEADVRLGAIDADLPLDVERRLFSVLLESPNLAEVTLTRAAPSWQVTLVRDPDGRIRTLYTHRHGDGFALSVRDRPLDGGLRHGPLVLQHETAADPTAHLTFTVPAEGR